MDKTYIELLIQNLDLHNIEVKTREELIAKSSEINRALVEYEKSRPEIVKEKPEYLKEASRLLRIRRIKERYRELPDFNGDPDLIPELPILPLSDMKEYIWPGLIKAGAIPKKDLIPGHRYLGNCRNATKATWDGEKFTYIRHKFRDSYPEKINHFEDDDGSDLFVPIKDITNE